MIKSVIPVYKVITSELQFQTHDTPNDLHNWGSVDLECGSVANTNGRKRLRANDVATEMSFTKDDADSSVQLESQSVSSAAAPKTITTTIVTQKLTQSVKTKKNKKKTTSPVWSFFEKIDRDAGPSKQKAHCL